MLVRRKHGQPWTRVQHGECWLWGLTRGPRGSSEAGCCGPGEDNIQTYCDGYGFGFAKGVRSDGTVMAVGGGGGDGGQGRGGSVGSVGGWLDGRLLLWWWW